MRSKRVGGANYQVPMQVNKRRQQSLAFRWIIDACREAGGRPMSDRLADELMAAFKKEGKAMTTREQHAPHGRCQQGVRALCVVIRPLA